MRAEYEQLTLRDNQEDKQFELLIDGNKAIIAYTRNADFVALDHTEVPDALSGRGVASALVEKVFRHLEASGDKIKPYCPYIVAYLEKHPEWNRLVIGHQ